MARVGVRVLVSLVAAIVAALLAAGTAAACDCALATVEEQVGQADVVARVLVTQVDRPEDPGSSADPVTYTTRASHVWKGESGADLTFTSALSGASCGLEGVAEGDDLVLFATLEGEGLVTTLCSGTTAATEELVGQLTDQLGQPGVPASSEGQPVVPGTERGWLVPAGIAVVAGLGVAVVGIRRVRRARSS